MAAFDQGPAGLFGDPAVIGLGEIPSGEKIKNTLRVIFGDVVEVIRNRAADVDGGITFQLLQQGQNGRGIANERGQSSAPREARTRALTGQSSDVLVLMFGPAVQGGEGPVLIGNDEGANRELTRAKTGEVGEGIQRMIKVIRAKSGYKITEEDADEAVIQKRRKFS